MAIKHRFQGGSVFFVLLASVGMVAAIGVTSINLLKGPVRTMAQITKRTVAENAMMANGRLTLFSAWKSP